MIHIGFETGVIVVKVGEKLTARYFFDLRPRRQFRSLPDLTLLVAEADGIPDYLEIVDRHCVPCYANCRNQLRVQYDDRTTTGIRLATARASCGRMTRGSAHPVVAPMASSLAKKRRASKGPPVWIG